jgi:hypothetical protein
MSDPTSYSLTDQQREFLRGDYLTLRNWASMGTRDVFHAKLPELPIGGGISATEQRSRGPTCSSAHSCDGPPNKPTKLSAELAYPVHVQDCRVAA